MIHPFLGAHRTASGGWEQGYFPLRREHYSVVTQDWQLIRLLAPPSYCNAAGCVPSGPGLPHHGVLRGEALSKLEMRLIDALEQEQAQRHALMLGHIHAPAQPAARAPLLCLSRPIALQNCHLWRQPRSSRFHRAARCCGRLDQRGPLRYNRGLVRSEERLRESYAR